MARSLKSLSLAALLFLVIPAVAGAIVEPGTEREYPDRATVEAGGQSYDLVVTGVGLREKTFMKVNVYSIVSYVAEGTALTGDKGAGLLRVDAPKQLRMDLLRSFSRDKLINSFQEVIKDNYKDTSAFAADMETFFAYFTDEAHEGDVLIFTYVPGIGLTTNLNGQDKGVIANTAFAEALWTVWFGAKPASDGLKKDLLSAI